jgi:hypothetical protein
VEAAKGCMQEKECQTRESEKGERTMVCILRGLLDQHLFRLVWVVLVAGPGWSGGWSELV